jgi:uncharacterized Zn-binding protein involved in type VI secretion
MPIVAVKGDTTTTGHGCDGTTTIAGSSLNVYMGGIKVAIQGNALDSHTILVPGNPPRCVNHPGQIVNVGSTTVKVNGIGIARVGDSADGGAIIEKAGNVFAGG